MHTDALFYRLFQERPATVFELTGLAYDQNAGYRLSAVEVKQTAFRLDGLLAPSQGKTDAPLIFVEAQFQPKPDFYARWFAAIFLYLFRHDVTRPWRAVVVYPDRGTDQDIPPAYAPLADAGLLQRVFLTDFLKTEETAVGVRLARLVVLDRATAAAEARALATTSRPSCSIRARPLPAPHRQAVGTSRLRFLCRDASEEMDDRACFRSALHSSRFRRAEAVTARFTRPSAPLSAKRDPYALLTMTPTEARPRPRLRPVGAASLPRLVTGNRQARRNSRGTESSAAHWERRLSSRLAAVAARCRVGGVSSQDIRADPLPARRPCRAWRRIRAGGVAAPLALGTVGAASIPRRCRTTVRPVLRNRSSPGTRKRPDGYAVDSPCTTRIRRALAQTPP
ncbi:hypothetical protein CKO31_16760 [Thiohalocapsa halophila]|uniref:Rpn family recombination-promoting nuclease/putative transposase n=1 Tax=Thiohalocapsa halophila TaxID=69359 RepID=A0ABS1CKD0_9GAMM|nr:hypothetical protein [Thiohalocapsa halophila]